MKKIILLLLTTFSLPARTVFIIVHGTWAPGTSWCKPGGNFFDALEKTVGKKGIVIPYTWAGTLDHEIRLRAARGLINVIKSYSKKTKIIIIAHSHGGNVAILASQQLTRKIEKLYLLGTPISTDYQPNMKIFKKIYNLFSFGDEVQRMMGVFERTLPEHERIFNIHVTMNHKEIGHFQLHEQCIAHWIATHSQLPSCAMTIDFFSDGLSALSEEPKQKNMVEQETIAMQRLMFDVYKQLALRKRN